MSVTCVSIPARFPTVHAAIANLKTIVESAMLVRQRMLPLHLSYRTSVGLKFFLSFVERSLIMYWINGLLNFQGTMFKPFLFLLFRRATSTYALKFTFLDEEFTMFFENLSRLSVSLCSA